MFRIRTSTTHSAKRAVANFFSWAIILAGLIAPRSANAETLKVGYVNVPGFGAIFIGQAKGYFAAQGLTVELTPFEGAQPVALAVVAGDIDFGFAGPSGGFYNLAGKGALRIIAGVIRDAPGFKNQAFVVSNRAYGSGLKSYRDMAGRTFAIAQTGGPSHYSIALLAEKFGLDLKSIRVLPLQSLPNAVSAVVGGQADATVISASAAMPAVQRGNVKLIGWVGDETPWQIGVAFASAKTTNERQETVERFLRAYRRAARDYHDAFTGPNEERADGPTAPEILDIIAKNLHQPPETINIPYVDADGMLDVQDIFHQIAWFKSQGLVMNEAKGDDIIDKRYVIPLSR